MNDSLTRTPPTSPDATIGTSRPDDLVVSDGHLHLVRTVIADAGADVEVRGRSAALGLGLLRLPDVQAAAAALDPHGGVDGGPLDRVLAGLRRYFSQEHAGWMPTIGKNRLVGQVVKPAGEVSHGGGLDPRAVDDALPTPQRGPGQGARVGVVDTGLVPHPWLDGRWEATYSDVVHAQNSPMPVVSGHATFVAGLVLQQAPGAVVAMTSVLSDDDGQADGWDVANAILQAGRGGVDVLNLSLQCFTLDGQPPLVLAAAIDRLPPDVVVVAAAGNHGSGGAELGRRPAWPAALDDVVAVGAADVTGTPAAFTPPACVWVDLLAPGVDLLSSYLSGEVALGGEIVRFSGRARWSGSSFASAVVAGAVAAGTVPGRRSAREALDDLMLASQPVAAQGVGPRWLPVPTR